LVVDRELEHTVDEGFALPSLTSALLGHALILPERRHSFSLINPSSILSR
jgi:hypothetical protein